MANGESYVILDARGPLLHSYNQGSDPDGPVKEDGSTCNGHGWGLRRLLETYPIFDKIPPRRIIAVWDGGNLYRESLWSDYKRKRKERVEAETDTVAKEEITALIDNTKELFDGLGITQVRVPGVEADDVIAMLCEKLHTNSLVVYTVDQDLLQLAGTHQNVEVVLRDQMIQGEHKGIPLNLISFYKSIVGDQSDGYPGVKGMGDGAFKELMLKYGADGMAQLEQIVASHDLSQLTAVCEAAEDKKLNMLRDNFEHWYVQYQVASLHPELCEGLDAERKLVKPKWQRSVPTYSKVLRILEGAGAADWLEPLRKWFPEHRLADNTKEGGVALGHFRDHLGDGPLVAFDYESYDELNHPDFQLANKSNSGTYVDVLSQRITGVSFCYGDNYQHVIYMPCRHKEEAGGGVNYEPKYVAWAVDLAMSGNTVAAHNASFEQTLTLNDLRIPIKGNIHDTQLMMAYVDENDPGSLKDYSRKYLGYYQATYKETLEKHGASDMTDLTPRQVLTYGCDDSVVTAHLYDLAWLICTVEGTIDFLTEREFEFVHEQVRGFLAGVNFDFDRLTSIRDRSEVTYTEAVTELRDALSKHCSDYNQPGATSLYLDLLTLEQAKCNADEISQEKLENWKSANWEKIYLGSKYVPFSRVSERKEIKLTPKPLKQVAEKLGLPPLEKLTKKFLTDEWLPSCIEIEDRGEQADNFMTKVREVVNAKAWKLPESPEYQALADMCQTVLELPDDVTEVGDELNFDSPIQMQILLYAKMGLPIRIRSKVQRGSTRDRLGLEGSPSTDSKAVEMALAEDVSKEDWRYAALMAYRTAKTELTMQKLFLRPLPLWQHPKDGKVHAQIKNCGTATKRPTGTSPNLLQLTKKDGGELRSTVKPWNDQHVIVSPDWNGQELRILASESKDPVLLDAYIGVNRKDIHSVTSAAISETFLQHASFIEEHSVPELLNKASLAYDEFIGYLKSDNPNLHHAMAAIRKVAKMVNFLIVYMGGYTTLARGLLVKLDFAKSLIEKVFKMYVRIQPWQQETIQFARTHGYTETAYGNRRHLGKAILSSDDGARSRLERQAVNYVIQGCAADILKTTLSEIHRRKLMTRTKAFLIAPVYDELATSVPRAAVVDYCFELQEIMSITPPGHQVPMVAEFALSSDSWGRLVEIGSDLTEDKINEALDQGLKEEEAA